MKIGWDLYVYEYMTILTSQPHCDSFYPLSVHGLPSKLIKMERPLIKGWNPDDYENFGVSNLRSG